MSMDTHHTPQALATRVYLVRHGETELNATNRIRGCADVALNPRGHAQAQALASLVRRQRIHRVVTGPLQRARQTAAYIARAAGVRAYTDEALLDRDYGPWTGWSHDRVEAMFGRVDNAPDIETYASFAGRVYGALLRIMAAACSGENIVIVGHQAVNRALLSAVFPVSPLRLRCVAQQPGCLNLIEFHDKRWLLRMVNARPIQPFPATQSKLLNITDSRHSDAIQ